MDKKKGPPKLAPLADPNAKKDEKDNAVQLDNMIIGPDGIKIKKSGADGDQMTMSAVRDPSKSSTSLDNLQIKDLKKICFLGKGASGSVDKMIHEPTQTIIALKNMSLTLDESSKKYLMKELEALIKCQTSDNIVKCYGAFYHDGKISVALEYMDSGSLVDIQKAIKTIPEVILGLITYQVLLGMDFLHKKIKVIHRDIKPANLLVNSEGQVKIADFGVCGTLENTLGDLQSWVGTTIYMSPERLKGEKYGADTDLWSLGLSLIELATGVPPFKEYLKNGDKMDFWNLVNIISDNPSPNVPAEGFSEEFRDFLSILLKKEGGARSSASELLKHKFVKKYANAKPSAFQEWLKFIKK